MTIGIVNATGEEQVVSINLNSIQVRSEATAWRIAGDGPDAVNTVDHRPIKITVERDFPYNGELSVPAYSANLFRLTVE